MPAPPIGLESLIAPMKLLAIETATEACSCALYLDGMCAEAHRVEPRRHAEFILSMVSELLANAGLALPQLDGLAFGRGPGTFTGVRIAAGVAQGLAFGADLPVAAISTLQALAQGAYRELGESQVLVAIDARMGEVYWGAYHLNDRRCMGPAMEECIAVPERVPMPRVGRWLAAGSGWETYGSLLSNRAGHVICGLDSSRLPHARDVAVLGAEVISAGGGVAPEGALPVYLRERVAEQPSRVIGP